jgi:signal transduction histidine kinase
VEVALQHSDGNLRLRVADDGRGFDPAVPHSQGSPRFGLATMRERAQSIGADLQIESSPGHGTRVRLDVPLRAGS